MIHWITVILLTFVLFPKVHRLKKDIHVQKAFLVKKCSVIIPARNEEHTISRLLESLSTQLATPLEVIVVNDGSTDRTKEVASSYGVQIVDAPPPPEGWAGKTWACWNGTKVARGDTLIFLDSDTWLGSSGLLKLCEAYEEQHSSGILTIQPYHVMKHSHEPFSLFFQLIIMASVHFLGRARGGYGQCMICSRESYERLGGHEAMRQEVVEHYSFAKKASGSGERVRALSGKGAVNMRMYEGGIKQLIEGWSKSFASGAKSGQTLATMITCVWIGTMVSLLAQGFDRLMEDPYVYIGGYGILAFQLYLIARMIGNFSLLDTLLFPVHLLFFLLVFTHSFLQTFLKRKVKWKGRYIVLDKGKDEKMK
ncbi:glycosyltransferase [Rossellomorea marisflavi]|uniref:glycosyltransferase n=1 Tax=Rossellomorea marisflavi TaxID=189381 RepID=UPI0025B04A7E|nr:glycosyltransferase [Rossellomorea marisflavi]WJV20930.1 glycosyltransferase [Rossellomorea marisflavi]